MVQSLDHLSIGSPLPNSSDLIAQQMLNGQIEIMDSLWWLHNNSVATLRSTKDMGVDILNGSWTFTPTYVEKQKHPLSYALGYMLDKPGEGFNALMTELCSRAEQEFYYGPLRALRAFILNEKPNATDRPQLKLPDLWYVDLTKVDVRSLIGGINEYCFGMPCIAQEHTGNLYAFIADKSDASLDTLEGTPLFISEKGRSRVWYGTIAFPQYFVDMTSIFNFLCSPFEHGLKQDILQQYRKSVNL